MKLQDQTPPQGLLGKAVSYTLGQWNRLERYVQHGMLRPDNNLAENAIRPFVVGRNYAESSIMLIHGANPAKCPEIPAVSAKIRSA
jgi:hypothetical protein